MNLFAVLPDLPTSHFANILPSLERHHVTVSDLLTLHPADVARRAQVPTREVVRLTDAVLKALHAQYGFAAGDGRVRETGTARPPSSTSTSAAALVLTGSGLLAQWQTISTLDETLDLALGGGIPTGYLTEITGESGAGKTQFLLTLLLSVQIPPLSRNALYITTEHPLQTTRLAQIAENHPLISSLPASARPSLSRILSISTPDLESQDHILRYQVPVAIARHNIGLLVIDSIAANYRAEFGRGGDVPAPNGTGIAVPKSERSGSIMARRSAQLMELGTLLRDLARTHNLAVVVANQVADRFLPDARVVHSQPHPSPSSHPPPSTARDHQTGHITLTQDQPLSQPSPPPQRPTQSQPSTRTRTHDPLTLNHQLNFFTGWGDLPHAQHDLKTPALGPLWANQLAARIALVKTSNHGREQGRWKRHLRVAFAAWAAPSEGLGVEFEIVSGGVRAVVREADDGGEGDEKRDRGGEERR